VYKAVQTGNRIIEREAPTIESGIFPYNVLDVEVEEGPINCPRIFFISWYLAEHFLDSFEKASKNKLQPDDQPLQLELTDNFDQDTEGDLVARWSTQGTEGTSVELDTLATSRPNPGLEQPKYELDIHSLVEYAKFWKTKHPWVYRSIILAGIFGFLVQLCTTGAAILVEYFSPPVVSEQTATSCTLLIKVGSGNPLRWGTLISRIVNPVPSTHAREYSPMSSSYSPYAGLPPHR